MVEAGGGTSTRNENSADLRLEAAIEDELRNMDSNSNKDIRFLRICAIIAFILIVVFLIAIVVLLVEILNNTKNNSNSSTTTSFITSDDTDSCDNDYDLSHKINFGTSNDNTLRIYTMPNQILPGVQFFTYSYNLLQGKPPMDLLLSGNYHEIIQITFNQGRVSSGSRAYLVPDQIDLPAITAVCESQGEMSSFASSTSTSSSYEEAQSFTSTDSFSASVSASGWGFSGSASYSMSSTHSHSTSTRNSRSASQESMTESRFKMSKAKLYSSTIRWDEFDINNIYNDSINPYKNTFINSIINFTNYNSISNYFNESILLLLNTIDYDFWEIEYIPNELAKEIINFFGDYGTHVLKTGSMGSMCTQSHYFTSGFSQQSYENSARNAASEANEYSTSISGGGSISGFSGSISGSYSHASESNYETERMNSGETTSTSEYSIETTYCIGEVYITSECGDMLGRQDSPSLVSYQLIPIFELNIFDLFSSNVIKTVLNKGIILKGQELSQLDIYSNISFGSCGSGFSIPVSNETLWFSKHYKTDFNGNNYNIFWDNNICLSQFKMGITMINQSSNNNITTEFRNNELNYQRYEYTRINYATLCASEDAQIAMNLVAYPGYSHLKISQSHKYNNGFGTYFSIDANSGTSIGSAQYLIICSELNKYIVTFEGIINPFTLTDSDTVVNGEYFYNGSGIQAFDTTLVTGYDKFDCPIVHNAHIGINDMNFDSTSNVIGVSITSQRSQDNFGSAVVDLNATSDFFQTLNQLGESIDTQPFSVTFTLFCNNDMIPTFGEYTFTPDEYVSQNNVSKYQINFDNDYSSTSCQNINVWTGISGRYGKCATAVWTENETPVSFVLVAALWDGGYAGEDSCINDFQQLTVQYIVICG